MDITQFTDIIDNPSGSLGYPIYFLCADGGILCEEAAREQRDQIIEAMTDKGSNSQWEVVDCEINYEDQNLRCDHTGDLIPSAYN